MLTNIAVIILKYIYIYINSSCCTPKTNTIYMSTISRLSWGKKYTLTVFQGPEPFQSLLYLLQNSTSGN